MTNGILQGCVLGAVLFVVFVNDLPDIMSSLGQMYADNIKVFAEVEKQSVAKLEQDLDGLIDCANRWQLPRFPQWGSADVEMNVLSVENTELKASPLKRGVGQYIAIHAVLTARDFFLANCYPSGPFTCIFPKPLPSSFVANSGSCVGSQNKIGHPARCRFPY